MNTVAEVTELHPRWREAIASPHAREVTSEGREALAAYYRLLRSVMARGDILPDDAHGMTVRWWLAYHGGIESAKTGGSNLLMQIAGPKQFREIAKRFAAEMGIDVPSAWILGLEEQHRIQENSRS